MDKWANKPIILRIVSVLLAVMLWFVVNFPSGDDNVSITAASNEIHIDNVALELRYDSDLVAVTDAPRTVELTLRGKPWDLNRFRYQDYVVYVDLTDYGPGEVRVPVKTEGIPGSIEVEVNPPEVMVVLEAKGRKQFGVDVETLGRVETGYQLGEPILHPSKVHAIGAESLLEKVVTIKAYVNVGGKRESFAEEVPLKAVDVRGNAVDVVIEPPTVQVEVPITAPRVEVPLSLRWAGQPPAGYSVSVVEQHPTKVALFGDQQVLGRYQFYKGPEVNLGQLKPGHNRVRLDIPVEQGLKQVEPRVMEVEIQLVPSQYRELSGVPIRFHGLAQGYKAQLLQPESGTLTLTIEGAEERLGELRAGDVQITLDVSQLGPGNHSMEPEVSLPQFLRVRQGLPERILFQILSE